MATATIVECPECGCTSFNVPTVALFSMADGVVTESDVEHDADITCGECGAEIFEEGAAIIEAYREAWRAAHSE